MSLAAAVITTFPNNSWDVYSKRMLESFVANWPAEIPIMVKLDDATLAPQVNAIIRDADGLQSTWEKDHREFVERNKGKDDPNNYRKQAVRFCHKVFALKYALDAVNKARAAKEKGLPRYLIWLDADVLTTRKVTLDEIAACMPKEGDAVSYLGRKDWPHSECGWMAFDLENGGEQTILALHAFYDVGRDGINGLFKLEEWHDSWAFDAISGLNKTNLTPKAVGMEVWPQSPMAAWSRHYKGPIAKQELAVNQQPRTERTGMQKLQIMTKNSVPDDSIKKNIEKNQKLIKNWIRPCTLHDEEIVVASAGPMLIAEDLHDEIKAGRKVVAVKHALAKLEEAGVKPWGCILLDPREHVYDFVKNPDKDIIWFVASQVTPKAVKRLISAGCNVWGYHASVGADENTLTTKQAYAIVDGGSATATRGLSVLAKLGFQNFRLYGYDLCLDKKPDLSAKDQYGQPQNFEIEIGYRMPHYNDTRWFWSKGELLAQADEFRQLMETGKWNIKAFGNGIVPFLYNIKRINDLRGGRKLDKIIPVSYRKMIECKTARYLTPLRSMRLKTRRRRTKAKNS